MKRLLQGRVPQPNRSFSRLGWKTKMPDLVSGHDFSRSITLLALNGHDFSRSITSLVLKGHDFSRSITLLALKGHDFSRSITSLALKGHDFSRAKKPAQKLRALAPEGWFLLLVVLICSFLAQSSAHAQAWLDCHFVPGYEQSGPKRQYTSDNLFEYRDGAAEGYLIYSFAAMQGIDCKSGETILSIDVSDMTDADSAYGMFSANRDPRRPIAKIGMGAQLMPQSLLFARGKYYVEIIETDGSTDSNQTATLQAFAAKIEPLLDGRSTPPEELGWFQPENQESAKLVPESVLGLKILKRGYVAKYPQGQAFIVVEQSPESAAEVMNKLRARFEGSTPAHFGDEAFQVKAPYLDGVCVFRKGRIISGYTNLPDPAEAVAQSAKLLERIP